jgi:transcriptional regulator of met regulon
VTDTKEDKITIKMPVSLVEAMKDEQHRRRKSTGDEPTYAELLQEAWNYRYSENPPPSDIVIPEDLRDVVRGAISLFTSKTVKDPQLVAMREIVRNLLLAETRAERKINRVIHKT